MLFVAHSSADTTRIPFPLSVSLALVRGLRFEPHRYRCVSGTLILSLDVFGKVTAFSASLVRYFSCLVHFETHELSDGNIFTVGSKRCRSAEFLFQTKSFERPARKYCFNGRDNMSAPNASVARKYRPLSLNTGQLTVRSTWSVQKGCVFTFLMPASRPRLSSFITHFLHTVTQECLAGRALLRCRHGEVDSVTLNTTTRRFAVCSSSLDFSKQRGPSCAASGAA